MLVFDEIFEQVQSRNEVLHAQRSEAWEEFKRLGFPSTRDEEWRYTSLKGVQQTAYQSTQGPVSETAKALVEAHAWPFLQATRLVFVNGHYQQDLSVMQPDDAAMRIVPVSQLTATGDAQLATQWGLLASMQGQALIALNQALATDGICLSVPEGMSVQHPVMIVHIQDADLGPVQSQLRHIIDARSETRLTVIELYVSTGGISFTNVVNEVSAGVGSHIEWYRIQQEKGQSAQYNNTQIVQEAKSNVNHVALTFDGQWVRNNLHFNLKGKEANSLLYGLYITEGTQHVDNHTRVDHAVPSCFSDEKYKGILKDQSTAVFNGKIIVHEQAQKTNAYQRNQNILLSDQATVNTKPQLEIFADDVKCTHGATIGQLDEEPLFYLRSRGIPESVAKSMLLNAFADDIAGKLNIPELAAYMEASINHKIG